MITDAHNTLTQSQLLRVLALQESTDDLRTEADFLAWAKGPLQDVLPHESLACAVVASQPQGLALRRVLQQNWPAGYVNALTLSDGRFRSPVIGRWWQERTPQIVLDAQAERLNDPIWSDVFHDMGLRNMVAHGVLDWDGRSATYFCFSRMPGQVGSTQACVLRLLTPHMTMALRRVLIKPPADTASNEPSWLPRLTERERVVLHWMRQGKTNWEIAQICGRSEHTIKNQVESVRQKLHVSNRAQACALAGDVPLISAAMA
jgi:transcriptional regulator EpsA